MEINIVRLQGVHLVREALDTTELLAVEFVLGDGHRISATPTGSKLYMNCPHGGPRVMPCAVNAISIEVVE